MRRHDGALVFVKSAAKNPAFPPGLEKRLGATLAVFFHPAFERQGLNAEHADQLRLLRIAVEIKLAHDHLEGGRVIAMVEEHGHHPVEVNDVVALPLVAEVRRDEMDPFREDGKLQLRHARG